MLSERDAGSRARLDGFLSLSNSKKGKWIEFRENKKNISVSASTGNEEDLACWSYPGPNPLNVS